MTEQPASPIFLDYQSTTPTDPRVLKAMLPWFTEKFGNPHSSSHAFGWEAEEAVERARESVAALIGASAKEVVFTSGATEANNLAIKGVARYYRQQKPHLITCVTEHECVLDTCRQLEREGHVVTYLPVTPGGRIQLESLEQAITEQTALVSIMTINNEIGVMQPIAEIGAICRQHGVFFHTDAAQAFGKIPLDVQADAIDLMSISGHKIYGPKGVGALYIRRRPRVRLEPLMHGGGQERGLRSGTLPTPQVVGLGEAARLALAEMETQAARIAELSARLLKGLLALPEVYLNGDREHRWPGCINVSFTGVDGDTFLRDMHGLAVSSGSACSSASLAPSYVLRALGLDEKTAKTAIRFGIGRFTTDEEIDRALEIVAAAYRQARAAVSPAER